jgi:hypothetical protein
VCGRCVKMANHPAFPSEPNPVKTECPKLILRFMKLKFIISPNGDEKIFIDVLWKAQTPKVENR